MMIHFEYPSGINQNDLETFLKENGVRGTWAYWDLNLFDFDFDTQEEYSSISALCDGDFKVKNVPVRGYILPPPPPKLERGE